MYDRGLLLIYLCLCCKSFDYKECDNTDADSIIVGRAHCGRGGSMVASAINAPPCTILVYSRCWYKLARGVVRATWKKNAQNMKICEKNVTVSRCSTFMEGIVQKLSASGIYPAPDAVQLPAANPPERKTIALPRLPRG